MVNTKKPVAWITGGSSGIGLAAARAYGRSGFTVVISGRNFQSLEQAVAQLRTLSIEADHIALDVTDQHACAQAASDVLAKFGRIDALVNSAGLNIAKRSWAEVNMQGWNDVFAGNLNGTFSCIMGVLPAMRRQGGGQIVNVSSWAGRFDSKAAGPAYMAAKHAVSALTRSLNMDEWKNGIRATNLCPGEVATPIMNKRAMPPTTEELANMLQVDDLEAVFNFIALMPPRACVFELVLSPTRNSSFR